MPTDEQLATGIQQGQKDAMTVIVNRYYDALLGYMLRMNGGQRVLAEDMVQETFLKMMCGIFSYDPNRSFKTWLYTIATNIVRNHYKRADTRFTSNTLEDVERPASAVMPETQLIATQQHQDVVGAILALPEHQRSVVVLYYYQELPQKEIAAVLNIPVGTVKSRLSLGLKKLREMLLAQELSETNG